MPRRTGAEALLAVFAWRVIMTSYTDWSLLVVDPKLLHHPMLRVDGRYKQLAAERTQAAEDAEAAAAAAAKAAQASTPAGADDLQRDGSAEPNALAADTPDCVEPDRAPDNTSKPAALPVSIVKVCCTACECVHNMVLYSSELRKRDNDTRCH
jgi:hypothetical protein